MFNNVPELVYLRAWATVLTGDRRRDEAGFSAAEWVVLAAIVIGGCIVIANIVMDKFKGAAEAVPTK